MKTLRCIHSKSNYDTEEKIMGLLKDFAKKVALDAAFSVGAVIPEVNELLYDVMVKDYEKESRGESSSKSKSSKRKNDWDY